MASSLARLLLIGAVVLTVPAAALAQDASALVARARALRAAESSRSFGATIHSTSIIRILDNASRFDLVRPQTIVHEAVGVYHRDAALGARMRITATRGTAPLAGVGRGPIENFRTLGDIAEISDDRIVLLNTSFPSPMAEGSERYYAFTNGEQTVRGGQSVQAIDVRATTTLHPAFDGTIYIARESGRLIAMELRPSESTVVPFMRELAITQTYAPSTGGAYLPDSLSVRGLGVVRIASFGLAEMHVGFEIASRLSDHRLDAPMPDSLRLQTERIVVRDDASDLPASFWTAWGALSSETAATIETSRATYVDPARSFSVSFGGMIDYNRAGGATPTVSAGAAFGPISAAGSGGYSFGLERPVGEASLAATFGSATSVSGGVRGGVFSQVAVTTTGDRTYPRIMNTLVAATLHQDYYNFMRKDGWSAGADATYGKLRLGVTYEQSRQFSIGNNASWSMLTWTSKAFPDNPRITDGRYTTLQGDLAFSRVAPFLKLTPIGDDDLRASITALRGERTDVDTTFELLEALVSYSIPLFTTGYNPITLTLLGAGGIGSATLPPQYQFRLRTSAATFGKPGGFVSPPKGLYGGTEYVAVGVEVNLTDLPWRAIGLPTIGGRGIELIVAGASARYRQEHWYGYEGTGTAWYSEVGVGLSRIPLFITDIVYGRVDVRRGLGPLGRFGGNFTFVLPL